MTEPSGYDSKILPDSMVPNEYGGGIKGHRNIVVHQTKHVQGIGRMAMVLVERWGMIAAVVDGEDSAGRSKVRLATPDELVQRACETAAALWQQIEQRGWTLEIPDPIPVKKKSEVDQEASA